MFEVATDDCIDVDNDVNVVQELIDEETVSEILMERNDIW
jgi:hypothetical protein